MIYGYARVSTRKQLGGNSIENQKEQLMKAGAEKIFCDVYTGTTLKRPELEKLLSEVQFGDKIIVTKLDRVARSAGQGYELINSLMEQGVTVHVLNMGQIDTSPIGKLIMQILFAFAEFERDLIVERTQEGKQRARQSGRLIDGRPKKYGKKQLDHAVELCEQYPVSEVVRMTGISKSTILRHKRTIK